MNSRSRTSAAAASAVVDPFESCGDVFDKVECVDMDGGEAASLFAPTTIHLEETTIDDVKQALLARMDRMEQNMTFMLKRVFTEIITLRKENAILKKEVLKKNPPPPSPPPPPHILPTHIQHSQTVGDLEEFFKCEVDVDEVSLIEPKQIKCLKRKVTKPEATAAAPSFTIKKIPRLRAQQFAGDAVIPAHPFTVEDDFLKFEKDISEDIEKEQRLVDELTAINCTNQDKYIRVCWRKLLADTAAEKFCWRGTVTKKSIRDFSVTIALQTAFQQKYIDDGVFERVTRKWFLYAHDRIVKQNAYHSKSKKTAACQQKYINAGVFEGVTQKWFNNATDRMVKQNAYHIKKASL